MEWGWLFNRIEDGESYDGFYAAVDLKPGSNKCTDNGDGTETCDWSYNYYDDVWQSTRPDVIASGTS